LNASSAISAVTTRSKAKELAMADIFPEKRAFMNTFMAYNRPDSSDPKKELSYGLMRITKEVQLHVAHPKDGAIKDDYGNVIHAGASYVTGRLYLPVGDGLNGVQQFLTPPRASKNQRRAPVGADASRRAALRWLEADPGGQKQLFVNVKHLLKSEVCVETDQEAMRASHVTSRGKALYLLRSGDRINSCETLPNDFELPADFEASEILDPATIELIGKQCMNYKCARESPQHSPICDCCKRSHCWGCTPVLRGVEERSFKLDQFRADFKKMKVYTCPLCTGIPQSQSGLLDAKATPPLHDDPVRVTCEPRQWSVISANMHKDIMKAKHIPRPANM
jgi:hypothetical protein